MITWEEIVEAAAAWDLSARRLRPEIPIAGSPERCDGRVVMEDRAGRLYVMERLTAASLSHKLMIARTLAALRQRGLEAVHPYLPSREGEWVVRLPRGIWQVARYTPGIALRRPDYIDDGWRGAVLAEFLIDLRQRTRDLPESDRLTFFSLIEFIHDLSAKLQRYDPDVFARLKTVLAHLNANFFPRARDLPRAFAHGDYHPLNVVWRERGLAAVIDWEFLGFKAGITDAANLVGCIGMEHPRGLTGALVKALLGRLRGTSYFTEMERRCFFDGVLAQRFAWLSEWLHRSDREMIDLECVYINLLHNNRRTLKSAWGKKPDDLPRSFHPCD
jgi:homoserine kinase type II